MMLPVLFWNLLTSIIIFLNYCNICLWVKSKRINGLYLSDTTYLRGEFQDEDDVEIVKQFNYLGFVVSFNGSFKYSKESLAG